MLGPWEEKLASTGVEIVAPKEPAKLIRVDAAGRIETLETMRNGTETGLSLPENAADVSSFADRLIGHCHGPVRVAA
ncbi:MAG: hypothetical protein HC850_07260 [Rhodomicrobium sp.]|nr:hypothetical protein [Rhodomicrobium sp.]